MDLESVTRPLDVIAAIGILDLLPFCGSLPEGGRKCPGLSFDLQEAEPGQAGMR